ncbi:MAG: hypothetical protein KDN19_07930, partial [Verrucomicrobiae bacterium]|nr:hypothetical protein [Verrucomicrobiae bacterium]
MKFPLVTRRRLEKAEIRLRERIGKLERKLEKRPTREKFEERKIFCIGLNKTGTTSLHDVFEQFGFSVGEIRRGERLIEQWAVRDFAPIIDFCHTAEAFRDCPFSLPFTYAALDAAFPNAKFILSIRDSAEQ